MVQNNSKDIITLLRCHRIENLVESSQARWLEKSFGDGNLSQRTRLFLQAKGNTRSASIYCVRTMAMDHVERLLKSHSHLSAEHILLCQLLVGLQTAFDNDPETMGVYPHETAFNTPYHRSYAYTLFQAGDLNGALTHLHRIQLTEITEQDVKLLVDFGTQLWSRIQAILSIVKILPDIASKIFKDSLDVLVLPYSMLAVTSRQWDENEDLIKSSFMWPWIRRSIQVQKRELPGEPVNWSPTRLDAGLRDSFGHTFLHAAIYSQDI